MAAVQEPPKRIAGYYGWLTWREVQHLRALRERGMTVEAIAAETGCGRGTVSTHTYDLGPLPHGWEHRTVAQEWQIVGLSGTHTQKEIAERVGVGVWTVHDVQRKYHIVQRFGRQHVAKRRYAYDEHQWGLVLEELYVRQRLSMGEVAERTGLHCSTVRRRLVELGFHIRSAGEQAVGRRYARPRRTQLPECETPGCATRVRKTGEVYCADCRRAGSQSLRYPWV